MTDPTTPYLLIPLSALQSTSLNIPTFEGEPAITTIILSGHHSLLPAVSLSDQQVAQFKLWGGKL